MKYIFLVLCFVGGSLSSWAFDKNHFLQVLKNYKQKTTVQMGVNKTVKQPLINRTIRSSGVFYYSRGQWRWDQYQPQKSTTTYDGKNLRHQLYGNNTVHKVQFIKPSILALLFNPNRFFKRFKYMKKEKKGRTSVYLFAPLKGDDMESLSLQIEKDRILHVSIQWKEGLGEELYEFSSIQFNKPLAKKWFKVLSE